jgi:hypothetical protein
MSELKLLSDFFTAIENDPRINTTHISLYMALLQFWTLHNSSNPVSIFSHEVMQLCKISGSATYHKCIKELNDYGYIKYIPSYYRNKRSLVYLMSTEK